VLDTARLRLRPPALDDADGITAYASDPEVSRYVTWRRHQSPSDALAFLESAIAAAQRGQELTWVITLRTSQDVIGSAALRIHGHRLELGYVLRRSSWGHGFAAEAADAIVEWSLGQPGIHRAWAVCDVDNIRSVKVLEKVRMQWEGLLRRWAVHDDFGAPRDGWCYAPVK
jgi:RimJ/RimL family protein N-acetyltransferase